MFHLAVKHENITLRYLLFYIAIIEVNICLNCEVLMDFSFSYQVLYFPYFAK